MSMMDPLAAAPAFRRALRQGVSCIIGLAGATGTGKSLTGLLIARGLAADPGEDLEDPATLARVDARIAAIDTESGRLLHYAAAEGELPRPFTKQGGATFGFAYAALHAPFEPEAYLALIQQANDAGFRVIMVDSFSHEWDGEGGCSDIHDQDLDKAFEAAKRRAADDNGDMPSWWNDDTQRDKLSIGAWRGAKLRHKRMVGRMLQCRAHLVLCMRAEDKLRIETKKEEGKRYAKTTITPPQDLPPKDRWQPVCEKRFPYELITSIVLAPDAPGVAIPLKLQEQHRGFLKDGKPLDVSFGVRLAAWARGAQPEGARPAKPKDDSSFGTPAPQVAAKGAAGSASRPAAPPDDSFPGDLPAPDPYSLPAEDAPPANAIWLGRIWFDPTAPRAIPCEVEMAKEQWQQWAKCFRELTEAATGNQARAWKEANAQALLRLRAASPAAHGKALEFCPPDLEPAAAEETPQSQSGAA